jgi:hypothetical protein
MKLAIIPLVIFLSACSTVVPVKQKFPDAPVSLTEKCETLMKIEGDKVAITDMLKVIVKNYTMYYECSSKVEGWNEWYTEQKKIFDNVNK